MNIFLMTLGAILTGMKLTGFGAVATWSWWLVLLPIYFLPALALVLVSLILLLALLTKDSSLVSKFRVQLEEAVEKKKKKSTLH